MRTAIVCNGHYRVCEDGKIFRIENGEEKELHFGFKSYYTVPTFGVNPKNAFVHRLIAQAFIPNPNNLPYVNHINGDKHDNRASNLEWVTHKENIVLSFCIGARKRYHHHYDENKARYEQIVFDRYGKTIDEILSTRL